MSERGNARIVNAFTEERFARSLKSLEQIFEFTDEFVTRYGIGSSTAFALNLAIEEIFTNMVKHNPGGITDISVLLALDGSEVTIKIVDFDADPFDAERAEKAELDKPLQERQVGGLGLHLVDSVMDEVSSQYSGRVSQITMKKQLGSDDV